MDYSINGYLNRLSVEQLQEVLKFCKAHNDEYKYVIQEIYKILNEKL